MYCCQWVAILIGFTHQHQYFCWDFLEFSPIIIPSPYLLFYLLSLLLVALFYGAFSCSKLNAVCLFVYSLQTLSKPMSPALFELFVFTGFVYNRV